MTPEPHPADPVRYGSRYGSPAASDPDTMASPATDRRCPVCQTGAVPPRARYCSDACKQRAYRLRRLDPAPPA